jgi:hypothetical protein
VLTSLEKLISTITEECEISEHVWDLATYRANFHLMSTKDGILTRESLVSFILSELYPGQISILQEGTRVLYRVMQKLASFPLEPAERDPPVDFDAFTRALRWLSDRDFLVSGGETMGPSHLGACSTRAFYCLKRSARTPTDDLRMLFRSLAIVTDNTSEPESKQYDFVSVAQYVMAATLTNSDLFNMTEDWIDREVNIYRLEDERTIDTRDALEYLIPAYKDPRVSKPSRFCYDQVLPLLPTFKYHLKQLSIPYDDLFQFTKLVLALDQVTFHDSSQVNQEAIRLCSLFKLSDGSITWHSFNETIQEEVVSK